jgi:hypothetical protein
MGHYEWAANGIRVTPECVKRSDSAGGRFPGGWALKTLALMANLTRAEREQVLKHALKVNRV